MKPIAFSIADNNNQKYADIMVKMFKHFNPDIEIRVYGIEDVAKANDPKIFYKATPYFARQLFKEGYDTILKLDADNFIFGSLNHIFEDKDNYDVGVVYNWNRTDPKLFGEVGIWDISPREYFNCGFVVMKNPKFVELWWNLCNERNFNNYRMGEQDILNILCYYSDYLVKRLDDGEYTYGLISKGENLRFIIKDNQVIMPKSADGYPAQDKIVKAYHVAGGHSDCNKMEWHKMFNQDVIDFINNILL